MTNNKRIFLGSLQDLDSPSTIVLQFPETRMLAVTRRSALVTASNQRLYISPLPREQHTLISNSKNTQSGRHESFEPSHRSSPSNCQRLSFEAASPSYQMIPMETYKKRSVSDVISDGPMSGHVPDPE